MEWLSNTYDPKAKDARFHIVRESNQSIDEAWKNHLEWLKGKVIGEPKATPVFTVDQLKEMGIVGVYKRKDD